MITGKLEKLKMIAYKDNSYNEKLGTYEVLFNPDQLEDFIEIEYDKKERKDGKSTNFKYVGTRSSKFKLNLLFDGTGIYDVGMDVKSQIKEFKKLTVDLKGETHKPPAVEIIWGDFLFKGLLTSLKLTYTLFKADGAPLRAKGEATFHSSLTEKERVLKENTNSPDLTHTRVVKAGDTLPLLTKEIYGKESYYLEVARFNKLKNFRMLIPGTKLYFPPLDKAS